MIDSTFTSIASTVLDPDRPASVPSHSSENALRWSYATGLILAPVAYAVLLLVKQLTTPSSPYTLAAVIDAGIFITLITTIWLCIKSGRTRSADRSQDINTDTFSSSHATILNATSLCLLVSMMSALLPADDGNQPTLLALQIGIIVTCGLNVIRIHRGSFITGKQLEIPRKLKTSQDIQAYLKLFSMQRDAHLPAPERLENAGEFLEKLINHNPGLVLTHFYKTVDQTVEKTFAAMNTGNRAAFQEAIEELITTIFNYTCHLNGSLEPECRTQ